MKKACVNAVVLLCLSASCFADVNCKDPQTQLEMNQCAAEEFDAADKELNALYSSYRKSLDSKSKAALKEAQSAWIKFRDLDCAFETIGSLGGSMHNMIFSRCLIEKT
ncbi:MAG: lysozyme inhibitor LprI family protein, partial [Helicobacteraceae bacterium]|nr:lysozyme inhibitor LprI family protein [Helicobacteraceae bacterium]